MVIVAMLSDSHRLYLNVHCKPQGRHAWFQNIKLQLFKLTQVNKMYLHTLNIEHIPTEKKTKRQI